MFGLTGKCALVTGASGGIGSAIAAALHGQGASVALSGTRKAKLEQVANDLGGERCHILPCSLTDRDEVDQLPKRSEEAMGQLDILVNNAGITRDNLMIRLKDEDWDQLMETNLTAYFRLARASLRGMMKRRFGRIINIASVVGVTGNPGQCNYVASKAGMIGWSKAMAAEVASRGITINCVAPGFIESAMTDKLNDKQKDAIMGAIPMKRMGTGAEVAASVAFLATEEAAYVTGQTIHVNGGMAMI